MERMLGNDEFVSYDIIKQIFYKYLYSCNQRVLDFTRKIGPRPSNITNTYNISNQLHW